MTGLPGSQGGEGVNDWGRGRLTGFGDLFIATGSL